MYCDEWWNVCELNTMLIDFNLLEFLFSTKEIRKDERLESILKKKKDLGKCSRTLDRDWERKKEPKEKKQGGTAQIQNQSQ